MAVSATAGRKLREDYEGCTDREVAFRLLAIEDDLATQIETLRDALHDASIGEKEHRDLWNLLEPFIDLFQGEYGLAKESIVDRLDPGAIDAYCENSPEAVAWRKERDDA